MLQEAHAPYPVKLSAITNMFRKQKADETLQDYPVLYWPDQDSFRSSPYGCD